MTKILCLSRSYLANLLATLGQLDGSAKYYHIVQTNKEEAFVRSMGGEVALNLQRLVTEGLQQGASAWEEPADLREVMGFPWSPMYLDRHLVWYDKETRLAIAGILHKGIRELFEKHQFDAFVSEPVAHFVPHLIYYHCRKQGTQTALWVNTYFPGYFYFADGLDISTPAPRSPMAAEEAAGVRASVDAYVKGVTEDRAGPVYHHSFAGKGNSKLSYFKARRGELPYVIKPDMTTRVIQLARFLRAAALRRAFPRHTDYMTAGSVEEHRFFLRCLMTRRSIYDAMPAQHSDQNVVYPLQYEPEASLLYFAPEIVDQFSFVETVLRALPANRILWVKEHPNQFGALGSERWQRMKKRYLNLRFLYGRESGRELIKKASMVVTISSTMGLDAMLLGRTTLIAGKVFFNDFTGAVRVESYKELAEELRRPENYEPRDNVAALVEEMTRFGMNCYPGDPQPAQTLFSEQNLGNLLAGLLAFRRGRQQREVPHAQNGHLVHG